MNIGYGSSQIEVLQPGDKDWMKTSDKHVLVRIVSAPAGSHHKKGDIQLMARAKAPKDALAKADLSTGELPKVDD